MTRMTKSILLMFFLWKVTAYTDINKVVVSKNEANQFLNRRKLIKCEAGQYHELNNVFQAHECRNCQKGKYNPKTKAEGNTQSTCTACPVGYYQPSSR